jgi:ribonuclease HI
MLKKKDVPALIEVWVDGLFEPVNHGGAGCFAYIIRKGGTKIDSDWGFIGTGPKVTNNVADYIALIRALERIKILSRQRENSC